MKAAPPVVVGIGASAGGLKALRNFFANVPEDCGLAFVVVVHLSPDHESHLADLLQPHVKMPVQQVTDATPLRPNHVYVIPPGSNLSAIDTHLRLTSLEERRGERAPIDHGGPRRVPGQAPGVRSAGTDRRRVAVARRELELIARQWREVGAAPTLGRSRRRSRSRPE